MSPSTVPKSAFAIREATAFDGDAAGCSRATSVAVLWDSTDPEPQVILGYIQAAAKTLGVTVNAVQVQRCSRCSVSDTILCMGVSSDCFASHSEAATVRKRLSFALEFVASNFPTPAWRNWQTRWTQNPVIARSCGFEPLRRHFVETVFREEKNECERPRTWHFMLVWRREDQSARS